MYIGCYKRILAVENKSEHTSCVDTRDAQRS